MYNVAKKLNWVCADGPQENCDNPKSWTTKYMDCYLPLD